MIDDNDFKEPGECYGRKYNVKEIRGCGERVLKYQVVYGVN